MTGGIRCALAAAALAVLAGCGTADEPTTTRDDETATPAAEGVPWERLETILATTRGSYEKVDEMTFGRDTVTVVQETARFDLAAGYSERTLEYPEADELTEGEMPSETSLRFIVTKSTVLFGDETTTEKCGAPWVDATAGLASGQVPGIDATTDLLRVEPLELLGRATETGAVSVEPDGDTWHELTAPAGLGMQLSSDLATDPAVFEAMAGLESPGRVLLPAGGGTIQLEIDHTEAFLAATIAAGAPDEKIPKGITLTSTWQLATDIPAFDTTLPTDVADASCTEPGATT